MGWSQSYSRDDNNLLFEKLTGLKVEDILNAKLQELGLDIVKREEISLTEDYYFGNVKGQKVQLKDGRVFMHKLADSYSSDDQGHDHYAWFEEKEVPEVNKIVDQETY